MSSLDRTFASLAAVPGAVLSEVFGVVSGLLGACERVIKSGSHEEVNLSFSVFGRKIGFQGVVFLLDAGKDSE